MKQSNKPSLQEQILELSPLTVPLTVDGKVTLPIKYTRTWYRRKKATEAILKAIADRLPEEKVLGDIPDKENPLSWCRGYNQALADIRASMGIE